MRDHASAYFKPFDFAQLKDKRVGDVLLFDFRLANVKLPGLAVMVGKGL
jgi:hypothetical protein